MSVVDKRLGRQWSLWPPMIDSGLNIVSGVDVIASEIISVLLTRRGEIPELWEYGLAPQLFDPLSEYDAQFWVYEAERTVLQWVGGLDSLSIVVDSLPDTNNSLDAYIQFTPTGRPNSDLLVFPWYEYRGAVTTGSVSSFLSSISINGSSSNFAGFPIN